MTNFSAKLGRMVSSQIPKEMLVGTNFQQPKKSAQHKTLCGKGMESGELADKPKNKRPPKWLTREPQSKLGLAVELEEVLYLLKEVEDKWPIAVWRDWSGLALMNPRKVSFQRSRDTFNYRVSN